MQKNKNITKKQVVFGVYFLGSHEIGKNFIPRRRWTTTLRFQKIKASMEMNNSQSSFWTLRSSNFTFQEDILSIKDEQSLNVVWKAWKNKLEVR